jgi:hypothetical protein
LVAAAPSLDTVFNKSPNSASMLYDGPLNDNALGFAQAKSRLDFPKQS